MESDFLIVLTTLPAAHDADAVAKTLVTDRLAACVNILPAMRSIYSWKGALENSEERQLVIKTTRGKLAPLEVRLRQLHPYDVPEFLVIPIVAGSPDYLAWLSGNTQNS